MSPLIIDKDKKKKKILDAALDVFMDKGFSGVLISDIARAADIGKGTVYEYFQSKEDLFIELLNYLFEHHQSYDPREWTDNATPEKKLEDLISFYIDSRIQSSSRRNKVLFMLVDYLAHRRARQGKLFYNRRKYFTAYRSEIRSIVKEGVRRGAFKKVDVDLMVTIITMILDGLMFQTFLFPRALPVDKVGPVITKMILAYLEAV
jgi:AcrR family transcriptional regulator